MLFLGIREKKSFKSRVRAIIDLDPSGLLMIIVSTAPYFASATPRYPCFECHLKGGGIVYTFGKCCFSYTPKKI